MPLKLIGNISHGEPYDKDGETKYRNTPLGTLFKDEEKNEYVVRYLGQWCKVWPPKIGEKQFTEAKQAVQSTPSYAVVDDEMPFMRLLDDQF